MVYRALYRVINRDELLSYGDVGAKELLLDLVVSGLEAVNPYNAVRDALAVRDNVVSIYGREVRVSGKVYVLGLGKASCSMARAVEDVLGDLVEEGFVVTKYGYRMELERIRVLEAGHPIPDENSFRAGVEALELVERVGVNDLLIILISGGGSSLMVYPANDIGLEDLVRTYDLLVRSGASIHEINVVRRHLSRVKGGGLVRHCRGRIISLIVSDVVGDRLEDIASGPTSADPTTFHDAHRILRYYGLWDKVPNTVRKYILKGLRGEVPETLKKLPSRVRNYIVASNEIACKTIYQKALRRGLNPYILTTTLEGEAKDAALAIGSIIQEIYRYNRPFTRPALLIAGGETTVTVPEEHGLGGPNQEFTLSVTRKISGLRGTAVLAIDTDGTDGPTDAAGGLVDSYTLDRLREEGIDVVDVLRRHDSYNALKRVSSLVFTGPTMTNVNSLYLMAIL